MTLRRRLAVSGLRRVGNRKCVGHDKRVLIRELHEESRISILDINQKFILVDSQKSSSLSYVEQQIYGGRSP